MKLLPCPFCGSADVFVERADYVSCYVQCNGCCARGPNEGQTCDKEHVPGARSACRAWNKRDRARTHEAIARLESLSQPQGLNDAD